MACCCGNLRALPVLLCVFPTAEKLMRIAAVFVCVRFYVFRRCEDDERLAAACVLTPSCAEELDRIEEGLDVINNDMKQAEIALKKMGKCCGICTMPWTRYNVTKSIGFYHRRCCFRPKQWTVNIFRQKRIFK